MDTATGFGMVTLIVLFLIALFFIVAIFKAVRIVPQSYAIIVERLGKFQAEYGAGMHFLVPFIGLGKDSSTLHFHL